MKGNMEFVFVCENGLCTRKAAYMPYILYIGINVKWNEPICKIVFILGDRKIFKFIKTKKRLLNCCWSSFGLGEMGFGKRFIWICVDKR